MANTIWVQALTRDRKVILSEFDPSHPTPNHEIWIVGYEEPRFNADGEEISPANPPFEVGDTPGVRKCISDQTLTIASGPGMARQPTARADADPERGERSAADKAAAEKRGR